MKAKSVLLLLTLCLLSAAALAQQQDAGGGSAPQVPVVNAAAGGASMDAMGVKKYLLGPGDVLDLRVFNDPQFNGPLVVNDEGNIEVPFIDQPIHAQCRTDREIKQDIAQALARFLVKPQISLRVTEMKSRPPATVFGAVRSPQRVQMQRRARLLDILAFSGGVTEGAGANIQVFHTEPLMCPEPEDEVAKPIASVNPSDATEVRYDLFSLSDLKQGKPEANPFIRPGDIIIVPDAQPVYITGAVVQPTGLYLREGSMSLKQAIAMVGGLKREAKASAIVIWRKKEGSTEPEKMVINFNDIKQEKTSDIALMPYDIIEVPDNSGSMGNFFRGLVMGGAGSATTNAFATLPLRILY